MNVEVNFVTAQRPATGLAWSINSPVQIVIPFAFLEKFVLLGVFYVKFTVEFENQSCQL